MGSQRQQVAKIQPKGEMAQNRKFLGLLFMAVVSCSYSPAFPNVQKPPFDANYCERPPSIF
jgi:hypothetical protein